MTGGDMSSPVASLSAILTFVFVQSETFHWGKMKLAGLETDFPIGSADFQNVHITQ